MRVLNVCASQIQTQNLTLMMKGKKLLNNKLRVYARKVKPAKSVRNAHTAEKPPMCNYGSALEMLSAPEYPTWLPVV